VTAKKYIAVCVLIEACLIGAVLVPSCTSAQKVGEAHADKVAAEGALDVIQRELVGLRTDLEAINVEDPDAEEATDMLVALLTEKTEAANKVITALKNANKIIEADKTAWGWTEAALGLATGFFPPLAVATPLLKRSRRAFEGVVASVAAGGGPKDPEAVRQAMSHYPGLKDRVTATRVKIGDKTMEAVKT